MVITDRYDHLIDEKNRLAIPAEIRKAMDPLVDGVAFYLLPEGRYLQLIPEKLFGQLAGLANAGLAVPSDIARARRLLFASATRLEPDKQGRVMIPDRFMVDRAGRENFGEAILGREVTLVGAGDRAELWNRSDFYNHMRELMADRHAVQTAAGRLLSQVPAAAESRGSPTPA